MNCSIIFSFCCSVDVCCITILAPHNNFRWLSLFLCTCFIRTIVNAWIKQAFTPASFEVICQPPSIQFRRLNFGGLTCISFWFGVQHYRPFMLFQEFFFWICLCISLPLWCFSPSNLSRTPSDCALESHQGSKFHWALTPPASHVPLLSTLLLTGLMSVWDSRIHSCFSWHFLCFQKEKGQ